MSLLTPWIGQGSSRSISIPTTVEIARIAMVARRYDHQDE